jgi:hypothetical protein
MLRGDGAGLIAVNSSYDKAINRKGEHLLRDRQKIRQFFQSELHLFAMPDAVRFLILSETGREKFLDRDAQGAGECDDAIVHEKHPPLFDCRVL